MVLYLLEGRGDARFVGDVAFESADAGCGGAAEGGFEDLVAALGLEGGVEESERAAFGLEQAGCCGAEAAWWVVSKRRGCM